MDRIRYFLYLFLMLWVIVGSTGCLYVRTDFVNYYFTIHPEGPDDAAKYSEKAFHLLQEVCGEYGFENPERIKRDDSVSIFLLYNKSMNISCYYAWDAMRITIKTQPYLRASEKTHLFIDTLRERLEKAGFKYRYEWNRYHIWNQCPTGLESYLERDWILAITG